MNFMAKALQPVFGLVDDDSHSARLLARKLLAQGAPSVRWLGGADEALAELTAPLAQRPALLVVDLKASSSATRTFLGRLRSLPVGEGLLVVAMAPSLEREVRDGLIEAGAAAVFERHAELEAFRREAKSIVDFWGRHRHLDAIGT